MREREGEERARLDSVPGQLHIVADRRDPAERAAAALRGRGAPDRSPRLEPHRPIGWAAEPTAPSAWAPSPPRRPPAALARPAALGGRPPMDAFKLEPSGRV